IGQKIIDRKALLAPFSIEEQEFLNAVVSLEDIETFQKEGIEFSRIEAATRLSEFEKQLTEPKFEDELWENLTKEANENMRLLKRNIKERLIPSITQSENKEDIQKAYSIIEKFAHYLLNPTVLELKDLNKSMSELSLYPPEKSRLIPLFGHPYMRHVYALIISGASGFLFFRLGIALGVSLDYTYIGGITAFFGMLAIVYKQMVRKR
ncbi:MAG: hypothetical protein Q7U60_11480, partial [Candidatus Methanoperedens sp.]|nr:hypothetical protein [Candidatus Methanoperedens sp.]